MTGFWSAAHTEVNDMSLLRTMEVALKALRRNPTRALLTALGIVIGIAAVIAMMEIGNGSSTAFSMESPGPIRERF